jgi:hypothetical protein
MEQTQLKTYRQSEVLPSDQIVLSVYQRRAIFCAMLRKARTLARSGAQHREIRQQVIHLRDELTQAALTDFAIRSRRGHLR